ncbi:alpha/beta hydrolase [Sphingobium subterraneum]|uniref:Arylformamidase n=1 Tax=Sphingobium subterraneum TaxID=627688 RepID=A0A841IXI5_9SPHN|nr:alpha/beta hydrolase [Sphingobium subterraneum]MBB6123000.1 arylformamidase [Sphingobium subterraneum]
MRIDAYPPQEPLPEVARIFHETLMARAEGIEGHEYSYGADPSQSLMVFPCEKPGSPVLMFMHGGAWTNGYKEQMAFLAPPLNAAGFTLVSASYRLAPKYVFPANFDDVADAFAKTWGLAETHGYRRDAIFTGGHSAGGHLAALLATRTDWQGQRGLPANAVKGCLPISATFDFTPGSGSSVRPRFLGPEGVFSEVKASPLFQIGERVPPFLVAYGSDDFAHLKVQGEKFAMVARAKGASVDTLEIDGADHVNALLMATQTDKPWMAAATRFMSAVAKRI